MKAALHPTIVESRFTHYYCRPSQDVFETSLSAFGRLVVHEEAARRGLRHESSGEGAARFVRCRPVLGAASLGRWPLRAHVRCPRAELYGVRDAACPISTG